MTRKENCAAYVGGWHLHLGKFGHHQLYIYDATLMVNRHRPNHRLALGFRVNSPEEVPRIQSLFQKLEPQFRALGIYSASASWWTMNDVCGRLHLFFDAPVDDIGLRESDTAVRDFMNKIAALLGHPAMNRFRIKREYDVRVKIDGETRWVSEGWYLAFQSGVKMEIIPS